MLLRHEREGCGSKKNKEAALSVPEGTTPEMRFLDALMRRTVRGMTERGGTTGRMTGKAAVKEAALSVPEGTTPEMRFLDALMRRTVRGMTERGGMTGKMTGKAAVQKK